MTSRQTQWISLALCAAAALLSLVVWGDLPERMPVHWNAAGEVDRWGGRAEGAFILPGTTLFMWLLLWALPEISPSGFRIESFRAIYDRVQVAVLIFLVGLHTLLIGNALGWWPMLVDRAVMVGVGALLVFLGNYLGKTKRNFFLGIRTPWTLASDEVWARTHRLGGWLMVGGGLLVTVMAATGIVPWVLFVVISVVVLVPVVYSFLIYQRIEGFRADPPVE